MHLPAADDGRSEGDAVMVHESIIRGYHVYKKKSLEIEDRTRKYSENLASSPGPSPRGKDLVHTECACVVL